MENAFIDRCEILQIIDKNYYSIDNLVTELLLYLNKLDLNFCPSFRDIFLDYKEKCYTISRKNKNKYKKMIKNNLAKEYIYHEDEEKTIFVFDDEVNGYFACYIFKKGTLQVIIDKEIIDYIICDLVEECIKTVVD